MRAANAWCRPIKTLQMLHSEGRNHIWAYYTRNLVRPVALARSKVDVIIGNPPWLNYNQTVSTLRVELERQSKEIYGIWAGGRYATQQDVAGQFFARSVDLYLKDGGVIGMVMPHSALQTGQYTKWRTGKWQAKATGRGRNRTPGRVLAVDFGYKTAWDLEGLEPNTFFPIPASVAFARRVGGEDGKAVPLAGEVERWLGKEGAPDIRRTRVGITDTSVLGESPYVSPCPKRGHDLSALPVLRGRDRKPRLHPGRSDHYREPQTRGTRQGTVAQPGPGRYHRPDYREGPFVRCLSWRECGALCHAGPSEGTAAVEDRRQ